MAATMQCRGQNEPNFDNLAARYASDDESDTEQGLPTLGQPDQQQQGEETPQQQDQQPAAAAAVVAQSESAEAGASQHEDEYEGDPNEEDSEEDDDDELYAALEWADSREGANQHDCPTIPQTHIGVMAS